MPILQWRALRVKKYGGSSKALVLIVVERPLTSRDLQDLAMSLEAMNKSMRAGSKSSDAVIQLPWANQTADLLASCILLLVHDPTLCSIQCLKVL